mgnify:CR=1 FL=1
MRREFNVSLVGVHNMPGALFQSRLELCIISDQILNNKLHCTNQRNDVGRLCGKLVGKLFVVRDEVRNINVAVVLLYQDVLSQLIPANRFISVHAFAVFIFKRTGR